MSVRAAGCSTGTATVDAADVFVFPIAPPQSTAIPRTELPDRLGTHLTRHIGPGVEYADIRRYVPGDQLRTVNWPVSARRGSLHVTERLTDRAADVVVLIDTYPAAAGAGDRGHRPDGARRRAGRAERAAQRRSGRHRRARRPPAAMARRRHRPAAVLPDARRGARRRRRASRPRPGRWRPARPLPPGAIVIAFSTLLDTEFALALIDLRKRGHTVVAVDVLEGAPFADERDDLVARMWSMQRSFMYRDMGTIGVDVVSWRGDATLDQAMHLVPDHRRRVRRRR